MIRTGPTLGLMKKNPELPTSVDCSPVNPDELKYAMHLFCAAVSGKLPIRCKLSSISLGTPEEAADAGKRTDGTLSDADLMELGTDALQREFAGHPHLFALMSRTGGLFLLYQHCGSSLEGKESADIFEAAAKTPMMKNGGFGPQTFVKYLDRVTKRNAKARLKAARS